MPAKPKILCLDCDTIFNRKPGVELQTCWSCKSTHTERLSKSGDRVAPPVLPPVLPLPSGPKIPLPPGLPPVFKPGGGGGGGGGGGLTPQMLLQGKAALKRVVKPRIVLPGAENTLIPRGIRLVAHTVKAPLVHGARFSARSNMRDYPGDFFTAAQTSIDLSWQLNAIAQGLVNPDHDNFNTDYRNLGGHLPSGLFKTYNRRHPFEGQRIYYLEYGWMRTLRANTAWYQQKVDGSFVAVSLAAQKALNGYWGARGYQINVDRLIIAETGEIVYTPDHYSTFYRYSQQFMAWYGYESAEKLNGKGAEWDESFYQ